MPMDNKNWYNIILLGFGFFLLFSAFQTTAFIQTLTISSYLSPSCNNKTSFGVLSDSLANRVGYLSGSIIYLMVAVGNWVSVSIVSIFGAKWSLVISGALYVIYIGCLIRPLIYSVFFGAFILGAGGGVLWTAQGQILIQNSSKERMGTTSGVFWFMLESSLVVGSIYIFTYYYLERNSFSNNDATFCFPHTQNMILFGVLTFVAICGIIVLCFITPAERLNTGISVGSINSSSSKEKEPLMSSRQSATQVHIAPDTIPCILKCHPLVQAVVNPLIKALRMLLTRNMILLCFTFVYTGYELGFWSGVYGTVIGHTHIFPKYYVGAALFFIGLGEIVGGGLFGVLGSYTNRWGRDPILLLGLLCHLVCFLLTYYFLPKDSIADNVKLIDSYGAFGPSVPSNVYVAMTIAFLLGFGDACFNTQIYSIIGVLYKSDEDSAPAMALYKFFQSVTAFLGFLTSTALKLQWQLLILVVLAIFGMLSFCIVEWQYHYIEQKRESDLTNSYEEPNDAHYTVSKTYSASSLDGEEGFMSDSSAHN